MLDDLRDYRYYAEDLVHPNYFATQYVWERFMDACISEESKKLMEELVAIHLAYKHKAFNPTSEQHKKFMLNFFEKTKVLQDKYPYLDFEAEMNHFNNPQTP